MTAYIMADRSKGRSASFDRTAIAVVGIEQGGWRTRRGAPDEIEHRFVLSKVSALRAWGRFGVT